MKTALAIDYFVPRFDARERHQILVRAPAAFVFETALEIELRSIPLVSAIIWLRAKILGAKAETLSPSKGFLAEMLDIGWGVLAQEPGRCVIAGAICRPWEADVRFVAIEADRFAQCEKPDQVKIAWTLETEGVGAELTRLSTETRAVATDEDARRKFRRYWRCFSPGIVAIRWLLLSAVRRKAERLWLRREAT